MVWRREHRAIQAGRPTPITCKRCADMGVVVKRLVPKQGQYGHIFAACDCEAAKLLPAKHSMGQRIHDEDWERRA